jgi:hypothetical protein
MKRRALPTAEAITQAIRAANLKNEYSYGGYLPDTPRSIGRPRKAAVQRLYQAIDQAVYLCGDVAFRAIGVAVTQLGLTADEADEAIRQLRADRRAGRGLVSSGLVRW